MAEATAPSPRSDGCRDFRKRQFKRKKTSRGASAAPQAPGFLPGEEESTRRAPGPRGKPPAAPRPPPKCSVEEEQGLLLSALAQSDAVRAGPAPELLPPPAAPRLPGALPRQTWLPAGPPGRGRGHQLRGERGAAAVLPLRLPPGSRAPIFPDFLQMAAAGPWEGEREEPVSRGSGEGPSRRSSAASGEAPPAPASLLLLLLSI